MAEEVTGQVAEQPFGSDADAAQAMLSVIEKDPEFAPQKRDETGKFVSAKPEEAKPEAEAEKVEEKPEEAPPVEEEKPSLKFRVRYKGEDDADVETEVEPEELIKGYMLQKDYSRKTAQLARDREAVQAKVKEAVEPKLKEYEQSLETYKQAVLMLADREGANVDLNKLAQEDPAKAQQLFFKKLEFNNALQAIGQAQEKLQKEKSEEAQKAFRKQAQESVEKLQVEVPGWGDEMYSKILKTGIEYGFKIEEVNAITDYRAIKVLNDARQWRELKSAKPKAEEKKVTVAPKVVKPGAGERPDPNADKLNAAKEKLRKTGRPEHAVEWAMDILKRDGLQ